MRRKISMLLIFILLFSTIPVKAEDNGEKDETIISMAGDVLFDGGIRKYHNQYGIGYPWEKVKAYFIEDDLTIVNLETSITNRGKKWPNKQYNFRSSPMTSKAMKESGIDVVTLANNHVLDYGYDGFMDTLDNLDKYEIKYTGAGRNKSEAMKGIIVEENGIKIGIVAYSRVIPDPKWYANDKRPGVLSGYDIYVDEVCKKIQEMKKNADIVVLSIHWGVERSTTPRVQEIKFAKRAIDSGADIVMGHHPHVLQGIEVYRGKPIFYSLGNFVFNSTSELSKKTMIGQIVIKNKKIERVNIIPCKIANSRPIPLEGKEKAEAISYINGLSKGFNTKIEKEGFIDIK
ncbi:MAG: Poly-gamma-glutamate synthesis protein (Capsule biosynthesis protein) [Sporanaerobacter sp.]|uniref:CapA family protein n=1 Tax=Sporanaerobacter sp. TaxID=2010183 RepID=UPI003A0FFDAE